MGLSGGKESEATDINNRGQIVGSSDTNTKRYAGVVVEHAFLWQKGRMIDLTPSLPPSHNSQALGINDRGEVVGMVDGFAGFLWKNGRLTELGMGLYGSRQILNEQGQVVGVKERKNGFVYAALWEKGRVKVLGSLNRRCQADEYQSVPEAINERGQVVGWSATDIRDGDGLCVDHAFLWEKGKMRDLGTLPGVEDGRYPQESSVSAINDRGQIVGTSQTRRMEEGTTWPVAGYHAFLWQNGKMTDLGTLAESRFDLHVDSSAADINDHGAIVGYSTRNEDGTPHATLWQQGKVIDLDPLRYSYASAISERGNVLGYAYLTKSGVHTFVWADGTLTDLGLLPGGRSSFNGGINDRGQAVGKSESAAQCKDSDGRGYGCFHAVLWTLKRG